MKRLPAFVLSFLLWWPVVAQPVPNRTGSLEPIPKLNNRALSLVEDGRPAEALRLLDAALRQKHNDTVAFNRALVLARLGRPAEALTAITPVSYLPGGALNRGMLRARLGHWAEGLADIQAAPIRNGRADERAFNLAVANWQVGRPGEAARALNETGPAVSNPVALALLEADLLLLQHKHTEAVARYNALGRTPDARSAVALRLAQARLQARQYDEAIDLFREGLAGGTVSKAAQFSAHYGTALAHYARHSFEKAAAAFRVAARIEPTSVSAQTGLAHALCGSHAYKAALTAYEQVLTLNPADKQARLGMAVALTRLERPMDALKAFKAVESLMNPMDTTMCDAFLHRGLALLAVNLPVQALAALQTAHTLKPKQAGLLAAMSEANRRAGRLVPAVQTLSDALRLDPKNTAMRTNRGTLLLQFDRIEDAYVDFFTVLQTKPKHTNALNGIGISLLEVDKLEEARFTFDGLVNGSNDKPYLHNNRGVVETYAGLRAEKQGQSAEANRAFELARAEFERAQGLDSTGLSYQNNLGNAYRNLGQPDEAARAYQRFLSRSARNNLAILLAARKRPAEARRYFESAVLADTADRTFRYNRLRFYRTTYPDSVARRPDLQRKDQHSSRAGISAKYSRDGYMTVYLYDFGFDAYDYPADHRFALTPEPLRPPDLQPADDFLTMLELPYVEGLSQPLLVVVTPAPVLPTDSVLTTTDNAGAGVPLSAARLPASRMATVPVAAHRNITPADSPAPVGKPAVGPLTKRQRMPRFARISRRKWGRRDCLTF
jgi:Flp pilus assembly protein TadD